MHEGRQDSYVFRIIASDEIFNVVRDWCSASRGTDESCFTLSGGHDDNKDDMSSFPFTAIDRKLLHILRTTSLARDYQETSLVSARFLIRTGLIER